MIKKIALAISVIFHPLLMPAAGIIILFYSGSHFSNLPGEAKRMIILLIVNGTLLLPLLLLPFIYMRGIINNFQVNEQRQRMIPLALTFIFYLLTYTVFIRIPVNRILHGFILASVLSVFITLIINFYWKISIHMVGLGGLTCFLLMISILQNTDLLIYFILAVIASGLTGSSRLILDAHTGGQIYTGFIVGVSVMAGCLMLY